MSNFKIIIDSKSFILGLITCLCFIFFSGFKSSNHECQSGRFYVQTVELRDFILDTETGDFVIYYIGLKPRMTKYKFGDITEKKTMEN